MEPSPQAIDPRHLLEQMMLIRAYEEAIVAGCSAGKVPGTCTSVGQEAAAVGAINALAPLAEGLAAAGHRVLNEVVLNQVLVAFGDDEATRRTIAAVQADGTCWCGGTVWHGRAAMRISVSAWATTESDVERSLAAILAAARR